MPPEEILKLLNEIRQDLNKMQETINELKSSGTLLIAEDKSINIADISDSSKYNLTQSAKLLKMDRKTLRMHCDNGLIRCTYSKANKRRLFTGLELKRYYKCV